MKDSAGKGRKLLILPSPEPMPEDYEMLTLDYDSASSSFFMVVASSEFENTESSFTGQLS